VKKFLIVMVALLFMAPLVYAGDCSTWRGVLKFQGYQADTVDAHGADTLELGVIDLFDYDAEYVRVAINGTAIGVDSVSIVNCHWSIDSSTWTALAFADRDTNTTGTIASVSPVYPIDSVGRYLRVRVEFTSKTEKDVNCKVNAHAILWGD
jgi:hypothetical protein